MQRQATHGLKLRENVVVENDGHEIPDKTRSVKLSVIREKCGRLLDKEATCCNLATD